MYLIKLAEGLHSVCASPFTPRFYCCFHFMTNGTAFPPCLALLELTACFAFLSFDVSTMHFRRPNIDTFQSVMCVCEKQLCPESRSPNKA